MLPSPYEAVLQNFTTEDKSKILYIPWKVSWPLSRLVSDVSPLAIGANRIKLIRSFFLSPLVW